MIQKMGLWIDDNEDTLTQVLGFGFAIILAFGMISLRFIL